MSRPPACEPFRWVQLQRRLGLTCDALAPARHVFTTRQWTLGSGLNESGWTEIAEAVGVDRTRLVRVQQVHAAGVLVVRHGDPLHPADDERRLREADIILSDDPTIAMAIQTADCVPVIVLDRRSGVVAAVHAGWRGLAARVPEAAVGALGRTFGSKPDDLTVVAGPSIGMCCYEVGEDVRQQFDQAAFANAAIQRWFAPARRPRHWYFDTWAATLDQVVAAGVPQSSVHIAGMCTASHPEVFCSYRRDGQRAGRMAAVIRPISPGPWRHSPDDRRAR